MNSPKPSPDSLDNLLKQLPEAYATWEKTAASPELARIEKRITELLDAKDAAQHMPKTSGD